MRNSNSTYWFDPERGHLVESGNGDIFEFRLIEDDYYANSPVWISTQTKTLRQEDISKEGLYIL